MLGIVNSALAVASTEHAQLVFCLLLEHPSPHIESATIVAGVCAPSWLPQETFGIRVVHKMNRISSNLACSIALHDEGAFAAGLWRQCD